MTKPKNLRTLQKPEPPTELPQARIETLKASFTPLSDTPLLMVKLLIDGKPLFLPAVPINGKPGWIGLQLQPQFVYFRSEAEVEAFHQEQVALMQQQHVAALWTPDKARKGLLH